MKNKKPVICQNPLCKKEFMPKRATSKYCSHKCSTDANNYQAKIKYNKNPNICKCCKKIIPYEDRENKTNFCSSSCAATFNNNGRVRTEESKQKISETLKGRPSHRKLSEYPYTLILFKKCQICGNFFGNASKSRWTTKTCSKECSLELSCKTNHRSISYFNITENKEVTLDSSWEERIAKHLDKNNIAWIRPAPIKYTDQDGKNRKYFPDFYLPDYDIYLDPKNPIGIIQCKNKLALVTEQTGIKILVLTYNQLSWRVIQELIKKNRLTFLLTY